jgi:putative membrane protein insertion efficiency factor
MIWRVFGWLSDGVSAILIGGVLAYRLLIRPLLPSGICKFDPTCSEYFIQAVKKYGPLSGAARGVWRICRCNPWSAGGHDPP